MTQSHQENRKLDAAGLEFGLFLLIPLAFLALNVFGMLLFSGLGHGTPFFSQIFAAPLASAMEGSWLGPLAVWLPLALLMPFRSYLICRVGAAVILLIHYFGVVLLMRSTDWYFVRDVWQKSSPLPSLWVVAYAVTQLILIGLLVRSACRFRLPHKQAEPPSINSI